MCVCAVNHNVYLPDRVDASGVAVELVDDVEVIDPCPRTIEAPHGAASRIPVEFSEEEFSAHRIVHSFLRDPSASHATDRAEAQ